MATSDREPSSLSIARQTQKILDAGYLSRQDYFQLVTAVLSDLSTTETERRQINRILDNLQMGRLELIDENLQSP